MRTHRWCTRYPVIHQYKVHGYAPFLESPFLKAPMAGSIDFLTVKTSLPTIIPSGTLAKARGRLATSKAHATGTVCRSASLHPSAQASELSGTLYAPLLGPTALF